MTGLVNLNQSGFLKNFDSSQSQSRKILPDPKNSGEKFSETLTKKNKLQPKDKLQPMESGSRLRPSEASKPGKGLKAYSHAEGSKKPDSMSSPSNPRNGSEPQPTATNRDTQIKAPEESPMRSESWSEPVGEPEEGRKKQLQAESAQINDGRGEVDPLTRRVAMQSFLQKMQEQLHVQPEEIVESFGGLEPHELLLPPEEAVSKVIANLGLNSEQNAVAENLFQRMLTQTASSSMAETLKGQGKDLNLQVLTAKEMRQKAIDQSLDKLNQSFFVDNQKISKAQEISMKESLHKQAMLRAYGQAQPEDSQNSGAGNMAAGSVLKEGSAPQAQSMVQNTSIQSSKTWSPEASADFGLVSSSPEGVSTVPAAQKAAPQELGKGHEILNLKSEPSLDLEGFDLNRRPDGKVAGLESSMDTVSPTKTALNGELNLNSHPGLSSDLKSTLEPEVSRNLDTSSNKMDVNMNALKPQSGGTSGGGAESSTAEGDMMWYGQAGQAEKAEAPKAESQQFVVSKGDSAEQNSNVRELISQARFLVQKGGGEMKIQLNPHGLGEVNLKVGVDNGQVNVEMLTESAEAKKILEKGLADLKATLASHKLNVEGIRVDVSGQLANEMNQQQDQAEKHFAHQFLQEFKHGNESWRRGFYDLPGMKAPKSQIEDSSEMTVAGPQNRNKRAHRKLDLVA